LASHKSAPGSELMKRDRTAVPEQRLSGRYWLWSLDIADMANFSKPAS
jgi:hypothetical protein